MQAWGSVTTILSMNMTRENYVINRPESLLKKKEVYAVKGSWTREVGQRGGEDDWAAPWGLCFLGRCWTSSQKEVQTESTLCGPRTVIGSFRPRNGEIGQAKWVRNNFVKIVDDFSWFWIHPCSWIIFLIMTLASHGNSLTVPSTSTHHQDFLWFIL